MKTYNKLVRDLIPQLIAEDGRLPITRFLDEWEYVVELKRKLQEEVSEFIKSGDLEELIDIGEVIHAILAIEKVSVETYQRMRLEKKEARGGFEKRIFLESVDE
ncbi:MAG: nucleoside triphosphate pyrophosphohydrolase [Candidatus Izemoplasmatales bacterium]|nr:nucleoside triphosphate pyrophosphohydrolase [Candidatus Izemoplasmatales bacterium]